MPDYRVQLIDDAGNVIAETTSPNQSVPIPASIKRFRVRSQEIKNGALVPGTEKTSPVQIMDVQHGAVIEVEL